MANDFKEAREAGLVAASAAWFNDDGTHRERYAAAAAAAAWPVAAERAAFVAAYLSAGRVLDLAAGLEAEEGGSL